MAEKKEKQYVSDNAQLMAEWNWDKNNESGFNPEKLTCGSNKKVWWKCNKGHEWEATVNNRNYGYGCPFCSGHKVLRGYNDLETVNPILAKEWNYKRNVNLTPETVTSSSRIKVWWICSKGHEWEATVNNRNYGYGCPFCSGHKVLRGYNDLETVNPILAKEWNYKRNVNLTPETVTSSSGIKVWWICSKGHEWQSAIYSRKAGSGCPVCSGQAVLKGYNDLLAINPALAEEWNYEKNNNLTPESFTAKSEKIVWWKCTKGHEWEATIANRNKGTGCPVCNSERQTSFPEYALMHYLQKCNLDVIHSYRGLEYELDIFIPSMRIAIEYDGYYWHKDKIQKDIQKNTWCERDGIKLYRIREGLFSLNHYSIDYIIDKRQKDLPKAIENILFEITGITTDVDLKKDASVIEKLREYTEKEKSILISNPILATEWNNEKNGNLKPNHFLANSNKKVWWKCNEGHEWQATIDNRNKGRGCPYCSGRKVFAGYNDLQTVNPFLTEEWNDEKNGELTPIDVTPKSHLNVWWKCSKGHEWQAIISNRSKGVGCPYCSGRNAIDGENDLLTVNPALAIEWNREKNGDLKPGDFLANSGKKVWWMCSKGHEWQATIDNRNKGRGCPYCAHKKVIQGENDLQTVNPDLAKEWNYEMNKELSPAAVLPNSGKKVWWRCEKGHEWQTRIQHRTNGHGCPECAKERRKKKSVSDDSEKT